MQNSKVKTTSTSAFTFLFSQCQSLRIGVRWEREDKNSGISLENAVTVWKEKEVTKYEKETVREN
jgi:hypothetical protein